MDRNEMKNKIRKLAKVRMGWGPLNPRTRCKPDIKQERRHKDKQRKETQTWE